MNKVSKIRAWRQGQFAETFVCWLLRLQGYRIVARRLRTPVAEIDILARSWFDRRSWLIAEVKYRQKHENALGSLTFRQWKRLRRSVLWLQSQGYMQDNDNIRIDYFALFSTRIGWGWRQRKNVIFD